MVPGSSGNGPPASLWSFYLPGLPGSPPSLCSKICHQPFTSHAYPPNCQSEASGLGLGYQPLSYPEVSPCYYATKRCSPLSKTPCRRASRPNSPIWPCWSVPSSSNGTVKLTIRAKNSPHFRPDFARLRWWFSNFGAANRVPSPLCHHWWLHFGLT